MKNRISFIIFFATIFPYLSAKSQEQVITFRPGPVQGIDAMIRTDYPDQNFGSEKDFMANAWTAGNFFVQRSLLKFDLSSIPSEAVIKDAKLSLWCNIYTHHYQIDSGDNESYLQRVTSPWQENTVNWNTQPSVTVNNQVQLARSVSNTQDYLDIDVTTLIKEMCTDQNQNYGFMLRLATEELYRCIVFASSDLADSTRWPQLVVTYDQCSTPDANFSYKSSYKQVQFNDSSLLATSWLWDFGDGEISTVQNPLHTYMQDGNYQVCLQVQNECGQDTYCDTISICREPISNYSHSSQKNLFVSFKDLSTFADSLFWDFGDDQFSYEQNPVHTYSLEGTYEVCLKAINACDEDIYCSSIIACNEPESIFSYYNYNYLNIAFVDSSLFASGWFWDFGDGTNSTEQNPIHRYDHETSYKVCLTTINNCSQSVSCDSVFVLSPKQSCFTTLIDNLSVGFTCLLDDFENIKWDFGDGEISTFRNPVHSYNDYGNYEIKISGYKISSYKSGIPFVDRDTLELLNKNLSIGNLIKTSIQPNPTNGQFKIGFYNFFSSDNQAVQLTVSNSFGSSVLFENNYSVTSDNELVSVDLSTLENGLYLIQIRSQNGSWTNKLIINRE